MCEYYADKTDIFAYVILWMLFNDVDVIIYLLIIGKVELLVYVKNCKRCILNICI